MKSFLSILIVSLSLVNNLDCFAKVIPERKEELPLNISDTLVVFKRTVTGSISIRGVSRDQKPTAILKNYDEQVGLKVIRDEKLDRVILEVELKPGSFESHEGESLELLIPEDFEGDLSVVNFYGDTQITNLLKEKGPDGRLLVLLADGTVEVNDLVATASKSLLQGRSVGILGKSSINGVIKQNSAGCNLRIGELYEMFPVIEPPKKS